MVKSSFIDVSIFRDRKKKRKGKGKESTYPTLRIVINQTLDPHWSEMINTVKLNDQYLRLVILLKYRNINDVTRRSYDDRDSRYRWGKCFNSIQDFNRDRNSGGCTMIMRVSLMKYFYCKPISRSIRRLIQSPFIIVFKFGKGEGKFNNKLNTRYIWTMCYFLFRTNACPLFLLFTNVSYQKNPSVISNRVGELILPAWR